MEEKNVNQEQENMEAKDKEVKVEKKWWQKIPTPVRYGLAVGAGAVLGYGWLKLTGSETPDVVDIVADVTPVVEETIEDTVETFEF